MKLCTLFLLALGLVVGPGCDGGPAADDGATEAHFLAPPERVELLFVVDAGPDMCEERAQLALETARFVRSIFAGWVPLVHFAVAVVHTDLSRGRPGAFVTDGSMADGAFCAPDAGPSAAACAMLAAEGGLPAIARAGVGVSPPGGCADADDPTACAADLLELQLQCKVASGADGGPSEGLEAVRLALDCNGPNRAHFEACCVDTGDPERGWVYDPSCRPPSEVAPTFLHPEAHLMVVLVSNRDDCSGGGADCAADALTPVDDYYRFLTRLKASPLEQLSMVPVVGQPAYTPGGLPIRWSDEPPLDGCAPGDTTDRCCPGGVCRGPEAPSCTSNRGAARAGHRYLELARALGSETACTAASRLPPDHGRSAVCGDGELGAACVWLDEGGDPVSGLCLPMEDEPAPACTRCSSICADEHGGAVAELFADAPQLLQPAFCLGDVPACRVEADGGRPCRTDAERAAPENRPIEVRLSCPSHSAVYCGGLDEVLEPDDWTLELGAVQCEGRPVVLLRERPPPGSSVDFRYVAEGR